MIDLSAVYEILKPHYPEDSILLAESGEGRVHKIHIYMNGDEIGGLHVSRLHRFEILQIAENIAFIIEQNKEEKQ